MDSRALHAKAALDNPALQDAFKAINTSIEQNMLECATVDVELASDLVRCKQILHGIENHLKQWLNDERIKDFNLEQVLKREVNTNPPFER